MKKISFLIGLLFLISCGQVKQIDTSDLKEEMRNSKPKRITEADLLKVIGEQGDSIRVKFNGNLTLECQEKYTKDGKIIELFNAATLDTSLFSNGFKGQLLEAYKYGIDQKQNPGVNVQTLNDTTFVYSFVLADKSYFKNSCHKDFVFVFFSKSELVKQM